MRVLYLHQYFTTPDMVGGTRSYEIARRLVEMGHTVHLITSDREPRSTRRRQWRHETIAGIDVHWVPVPYSNQLGHGDRVRAFVDFARRAATRAVALGGDLVFATSTPLTIAIPGIYASRALKVPMVFEVRDLWPEVPIAVGVLQHPLLIAAARWLERAAYRHATEVVALSPGIKQGVVKAGMPDERVSVIPNGCDSALFNVGPERGRAFRAKFPWLGERPLVVYGGTLGAVNAVDDLARIAAEMYRLDPEVRFLVVGTGREEQRVRRTAAELGVLDHTFFMIGSLPKHEMPDCLSAATVATSLFVDLEAMWHNSANKFFDALAARRPVMINYGGWQADLLTETGAGIVVSPREPATAAGHLHLLLRSPERLARARCAADALAAGPFDRDRLAAELLRVLERALGASARVGARVGPAGTGRFRAPPEKPQP
jgi:glycosyltransferase involved in cell wall biosynthesis